MTAALLLAQALSDDKDEEYNKFLYVLINALNKAKADVLFYSDPASTLQVLNNLVPTVNALARVFSIGDVAMDVITGNGEIQSGPFQGMNKLTKWAMDITPGSAGAVRMINAGSRQFDYK